MVNKIISIQWLRQAGASEGGMVLWKLWKFVVCAKKIHNSAESRETGYNFSLLSLLAYAAC